MSFNYDIDITPDNSLTGVLMLIEQSVGVPCSLSSVGSTIYISCKNTTDFTQIYLYMVKYFYEVLKDVLAVIVDFNSEAANYATFEIHELMKSGEMDYICNLIALTWKVTLKSRDLYWYIPTSELTPDDARKLRRQIIDRGLRWTAGKILNTTSQSFYVSLYLKAYV